jgi:hypothetical protein
MVDGASAERSERVVMGRFGDQMRAAARSLLDEKKERVATAVEAFADAFRHAAWTLDRNRQSRAARCAEQAAVRVERVSASVRNLYFSNIVASANGFAHRRPALFVAGAIATGFVLSRLLSQPGRGDRSLELSATQERL